MDTNSSRLINISFYHMDVCEGAHLSNISGTDKDQGKAVQHFSTEYALLAAPASKTRMRPVVWPVVELHSHRLDESVHH